MEKPTFLNFCSKIESLRQRKGPGPTLGLLRPGIWEMLRQSQGGAVPNFTEVADVPPCCRLCADLEEFPKAVDRVPSAKRCGPP